jgi:hypothetical protein
VILAPILQNPELLRDNSSQTVNGVLFSLACQTPSFAL